MSRFMFVIEGMCQLVAPLWPRDVHGVLMSVESKEVEIFWKTCRDISWMPDSDTWLFVPC